MPDAWHAAELATEHMPPEREAMPPLAARRTWHKGLRGTCIARQLMSLEVDRDVSEQPQNMLRPGLNLLLHSGYHLDQFWSGLDRMERTQRLERKQVTRQEKMGWLASEPTLAVIRWTTYHQTTPFIPFGSDFRSDACMMYKARHVQYGILDMYQS